MSQIKDKDVNDAAPLMDYSYFFMIAESAMKDMHEAMIHRQYDKALEYITLAQIELRMTYNAIQHEKEQSNG